MKTFTKLLLMLFLWAGCAVQLQAQSKPPVKIGDASEVRARFEAKVNEIQRGAHAQISQKVPDQSQSPLVLNLKSSKKEGSASLFYGEIKNAKNSNFYLKIEGKEVTGSIILRDQKKYYSYSSTANGTVVLTEEDIDEILCTGYPESHGNITTSDNSMGTESVVVPELESLPGAEAVVLLDFDGHTVTNTLWNSSYNNGKTIVAEPSAMNERQITEIWELISEDFRPFELNITTSEAVFNNAPVDKRVRIIFTPTNYFLPDYGGYAYIGSFAWGGTTRGETPAFVWNFGIKGAGEAGSHEIGHTLYLVHDGRTEPHKEEYYYGHDDWAPIMGAGYSKSVVQWSKGEYPYANNFEDDLEIMATRNGFGYRADDHGDTDGDATALFIAGGGDVLSSANNGVITTRTDVDVFSFTTGGGNVELNVDPDPSYHPNLDILLTLRNSDDEVVATADSETLSASINQVLEAGTYYLQIEGTMGSLGANSDYASLGVYFISGSIPTNVSLVVNITSPGIGDTFTAPAEIMIEAEASDENGSVARVEFFSGESKLGEDLEAPYTYNWSDVREGSYVLTAKATNNYGATSTSSPVEITVNENQVPVVSITAPADGQGFTAPATINLSADASDSDGTVDKVEFFSGDTKLGEALEAPYSYSWSDVGAGTYTLTAKATDNMGAITSSDPVEVTVSENQSPVISIVSPNDGESFMASADIMIEAEASDEDGEIARVEFFSGDTKLGEAVEAPYSYSWSGVSAGSYELTARATDNYGATTTSKPVAVTVTENQAPVVSIISPADGESFMAPADIMIEAEASDEDGSVAKVEFFNGDTKLGEDQEAPYAYNWSDVSTGSYTLTARATDNLGATTTTAVVTVTVTANRNQAPVASITSPSDGYTLTIPQNPIYIAATASDVDGTVTKVEFFNGDNKLGEVLEAPYTYSWRQPHRGTYSITVRATDNMGVTTTSDAVLVTVVLPGKGNSKDKGKGKNKDKNKAYAFGKNSSTDLIDNELAEPGVYPNPVAANSMVKVDLPVDYTDIKVILHELSTGKKISESTYSNTQAVQLDVSALSRGLYIITITAEDNIWTKKLMVLP